MVIHRLTTAGAACLAAAWLLVVGCETSAPTASVEPAGKRTTKPTLNAKRNATAHGGYTVEIGDRNVRAVTTVIGPAGGELIVDETGGRPHDNLLVTFTVPPGALSDAAPITMYVSGEQLSELTVDFSPSGLAFDPWARLHLHLGIERVDVDPSTLSAVHILADGTEIPVDSQVSHRGNSKGWQIWVDVPGFSRYGLR